MDDGFFGLAPGVLDRAQRRGMAIDHTGRRLHQRTGRVPPHGPGERIEETAAPEEEPLAESEHRDPRPEYKRELPEDDVPGMKKTIH